MLVWTLAIDQQIDQYVASSASISVLDADGDGFAQVSNTGTDPIYQAFLDGDPVLNLLSDPTVLTCTLAGCIETAIEGPVSGPLLPQVGPAEIGITLRFTLSAGDAVSGLARFEVVPEPTTAVLLGAGFLMMGVRTRRRRQA